MTVSLKKFFKIIGIIIIAVVVVGVIMLFFYAKNHNKKAEERRSLVESFKSDNYNDYISHSVYFSKSGDFAKSFIYINKAVEINPKINLGYRIHIKLRFLRDYDGALEDMNALESLTPGFQNAPWGEDIDFLRGECYFGKKEYEKAITYFKKSIEVMGSDFADIHSFVYIGISEYKLNNKQNAISYFEKALEQSLYTPEAYFWLAKIYFEDNKSLKALENINLAETHFKYKRTDPYTEFLNEIYIDEVVALKKLIQISNHSALILP